MNTAKVVTGWGVSSGWTSAARTKLLSSCQNVILRTVAGDPSYANRARALPEKNLIEQELQLWLTTPRTAKLWIEVGNEPNISAYNQDYTYAYRWHLDNTLNWLRQAAPNVNVIAPAFLLGKPHGQKQFLSVCADVFEKYDAIAVHMYEHDSFVKTEQKHGTTGQYEEFLQLYAKFNKPIIISEIGINDPDTAQTIKGRRYKALVTRKVKPVLPKNVVGMIVYHFCAAEDIDPQYHFGRLAQTAYRV